MAIRIPVLFDADTTDLDTELARSTKKSSTTMVGVLGKTLKRGAQVAGAGMVAILGTSIVKGFNRLRAIDDAEAKLRGIGVTGKALTSVMSSVTKAVTGTAFGLDEAAGAAAGALSAGIKPGRELSKYLTLTGDAAAQAGTDFNTMALLMNKVQGSGKLAGDTLQQLTENQLFVLPMLSKAYGKSSDEMRKMVSMGKVSSEDFRRILNDNIGGAAQEMGKTFRGSLANMGAALGRFGAVLIGPIFERLPSLFIGIQGAIGDIMPVAEKAAGGIEKLISAVTGAVDFGAIIGEITAGFSTLVQSIDFGGIMDSLRGAFSGGGGIDFSNILDAFKALSDFAKPLLKEIGSIASQIGVLLGPALADIGRIIVNDVLPAFKSFLPVIQPVAKFLLKLFGSALIGVFKGLVNVIKGVLTTIAGIFEVLTGVFTGDWSKAWSGLVKIVTGVGRALLGAIQVLWNGSILGVFRKGILFLTKGLWAGLWKGLVSGGKAGMKSLGGLVSAGLNAVKNLFITGVKAYVGLWRTFFTTALAIIRNGWAVARSAFGGALAAIRTVVTSAFNAIRNTITNAFKAAVNGVRSSFSAMRSAATSGIRNVVSSITSLPSKIGALGGKMRSAGKNLIDKLFEGIKSAASSVGGLVASIATSLKNGINSLLKLPIKTPKISVKGVTILGAQTIIPRFARGGVAPGGLALVGEEGPEIVNLPRGARVTSNGESKTMARSLGAAAGGAGGGSSVLVNNNFYGPTTSGGRLREMDWTIRYATAARDRKMVAA